MQDAFDKIWGGRPSANPAQVRVFVKSSTRLISVPVRRYLLAREALLHCRIPTPNSRPDPAMHPSSLHRRRSKSLKPHPPLRRGWGRGIIMVRSKQSSSKKPKGVDFKKIKHKIGRKLPPPKNATNTQIKSKATVLPEQSVASERAGLAVNKKGLTLRELLKQTSHHNAKIRKDDRNNLEKLTLAVLSHMPTAVLYVHDLSGECGTSPKDQFITYKAIKEKFEDRLWLDVVSKCDLLQDSPSSILDADDDVEKYKRFGPDGAIRVSIKSEVPVSELKSKVHDLLMSQMAEIRNEESTLES